MVSISPLQVMIRQCRCGLRPDSITTLPRIPAVIGMSARGKPGSEEAEESPDYSPHDEKDQRYDEASSSRSYVSCCTRRKIAWIVGNVAYQEDGDGIVYDSGYETR